MYKEKHKPVFVRVMSAFQPYILCTAFGGKQTKTPSAGRLRARPDRGFASSPVGFACRPWGNQVHPYAIYVLYIGFLPPTFFAGITVDLTWPALA